MRELDGPEFQALARLLTEHPEVTVDRLRELVETQGNRRHWSVRAEAVRPRTTADVVALLEAKVITRVEARRYLRLR